MLKDKQQAFVDEYIVDFNATQAAIRAGYSKKTAGSMGGENLKKPEIQQAIAIAIEERTKRVQVDADYVLKRLVDIDQMDIMDILTDDLGIRPITEWPDAWRRTISSVDVYEEFTNVGNERVNIGLIKKLKLPDKVKNLELLGRHVNVQAWKDKTETDVNLGLAGILNEIDGSTSDLPSNDR